MKENNKINEAPHSHRIVSPALLASKNKGEIITLLKQIANENKITVGEAATALAEALKNYMNV